MGGRYEQRTWAHDPTIYAPSRYRRACTYETFLPDPIAPLTISLPGHLAATISDAEGAIGRLNAGSHAALGPMARLLLRTESIGSSKVEGLQVDGRSLARAEVADETGRRVGADASEVLGNIKAMQYAIDRTASAELVGPEDVVGIHRTLMERAPDQRIAGILRVAQNWIGGNDYNPCDADYVPPPADRVIPLMEDLCEFIARDDLPPLIQAAIAHAQFETVHPFDDGNGRTGRALIHVILKRRGLATSFVPPISVVFARNKERYIEGLTRFRTDDLSDWLEIFAVAAAEAALLATSYLEAVGLLQDEWRSGLIHPSTRRRADSTVWSIIDVLPAQPVMTIATLVAQTGRSKPALGNAVSHLVEAGVLLPLSTSPRNRAWEAAGLIDLLTDLEEGRPLPG